MQAVLVAGLQLRHNLKRRLALLAWFTLLNGEHTLSEHVGIQWNPGMSIKTSEHLLLHPARLLSTGSAEEGAPGTRAPAPHAPPIASRRQQPPRVGPPQRVKVQLLHAGPVACDTQGSPGAVHAARWEDCCPLGGGELLR